MRSSEKEKSCWAKFFCCGSTTDTENEKLLAPSSVSSSSNSAVSLPKPQIQLAERSSEPVPYMTAKPNMLSGIPTFGSLTFAMRLR